MIERQEPRERPEDEQDAPLLEHEVTSGDRLDDRVQEDELADEAGSERS